MKSFIWIVTAICSVSAALTLLMSSNTAYQLGYAMGAGKPATALAIRYYWECVVYLILIIFTFYCLRKAFNVK